METVSIGTTQNISIDYKLAGLMERILAVVVDLIIIAAYGLVTILLSSLLFDGESLAFVIINFALAYLYFLLSEIFMEGQTIGKKMMRIKVVKTNGSKPSISAYLLRWIMLPIDYSLTGAIAMVFIIFTKKAQRLGDLLAGTTVVQEKTSEANLTQMKRLFDRMDENYEPTFPEAMNITTRENRIIEEAIKAFRKHGQLKPAEVLKEKMQERLSIQSDMPTVKFLRTLSEDYHYYASR